jgi:hypothetical protein
LHEHDPAADAERQEHLKDGEVERDGGRGEYAAQLLGVEGLPGPVEQGHGAAV